MAISYADNGEISADKKTNLNLVKLYIEIAQLEYYLVCHGTFLLSDRTVCCTI
jgi:hypothetical protein